MAGDQRDWRLRFLYNSRDEHAPLPRSSGGGHAPPGGTHGSPQQDRGETPGRGCHLRSLDQPISRCDTSERLRLPERVPPGPYADICIPSGERSARKNRVHDSRRKFHRPALSPLEQSRNRRAARAPAPDRLPRLSQPHACQSVVKPRGPDRPGMVRGTALRRSAQSFPESRRGRGAEWRGLVPQLRIRRGESARA